MKGRLFTCAVAIAVIGLLTSAAVGATNTRTMKRPAAARTSTANTYGLWLPLRGTWRVGCTWNMGSGGGSTCGPNYHCPDYCPAIDFARFAPNSSVSIAGDPVYAAANGTARISSTGSTCGSGTGNVVQVDHGNGLTTRYYHLKSFAFSGTRPVTPYTVIGYVGNTGNVSPCTYNHLHFEVRLNNTRISNRLVACRSGNRLDYPFAWGISDWPQVPLWKSIASDGPWCNNNVIRSVANGRYVSAELGYGGSSYGMLRARATTIGGWERFKFIGNCALTSGCLIRSTANGRYVAAELNYSGSSRYMLRARTVTPGSWERFWIKQCDSSAGCLIKSVAAGKYVAAELGYSSSRKGMLRARTAPAYVGSWERFRLGKG